MGQICLPSTDWVAASCTSRLVSFSLLAAERQDEGTLTRRDIRERMEEEGDALLHRQLREVVRADTIVANADESFSVVVYRMADKGFTRRPVVDRSSGQFL